MKNRKIILATAVTFATFLCLAEMSIKVDEKTQKYTIQDNGRPVLTYNFGSVPVPPGVGGIYAVARSDYVHPLYGPSGEVLTEDFTVDHPHHRGIYWAWPEVTYQGEKRDLHALQGVFARPVKVLNQEADKESAVLRAENLWKWGDSEDIVREFATITAYPAKDGLQVIDFAFRFEALKEGITLARRGQNAYGGFNFRMSGMTAVEISKQKDAPGAYPCQAWAELSGTPPKGKETVGMFILQSPSNPLYPGDWVEYANLPWLQPTFPAAGIAYELKQGTPLELAYRIIIRNGAGLKTAPAKLFTEYAGDLPDPLTAMAAYIYGEERTTLTSAERAIRSQTKPERVTTEKRILKILKENKTSPDFEKWAFGQLQLCGSAASVPVAAAYLNKESWMQALDAMIAVPGEASAAAIISALPALPAERRAAVIQGLGVRRDALAIPVIAEYAAGKDKITALPALVALGRIGTDAAALRLNTIKVIHGLEDELLDARVQCAGHLGKTETAEKIYTAIWSDSTAQSWYRAAALIGLAKISESAVKEILPALSSEDSHIRNGAAAALNYFDKESLVKLQSGFDNLPDAVRMIVLKAWSQGEVTESEAKILSQLQSANPELQLTAIRALRETGGGASVAPLLQLAAADGAAAAEAKITLVQLHGEETFQALAKAVRSGDSQIANVAVRTITDRQDPGCLDLMMEIAKAEDPKAAESALTFLRSSGTAREIPALRQLLLTAENRIKPAVAGGIVGICKREDSGADIAAVLNGKPELTGGVRDAMIGALSEIGGEAALAFVIRTQDESAVRALLKWPDLSAVRPLRTIVENKAADDKLNKLASSGLFSLIKSTMPLAAQSLELKSVLPHIRDAAVKNQISDYLSELNKVNIAKGKPVTASHPWQEAAKPELAVDGNIGSYWSCAHSPTSITVDLGVAEKVSSVKVVNYFSDNRYYQYTVEISIDDETWKQVADMSQNMTPATEAGTTHKFEPTPARYVRVTMLKNSANPGMHIVELEVYGGGILD